jgi:hypothetical protein
MSTGTGQGNGDMLDCYQVLCREPRAGLPHYWRTSGALRRGHSGRSAGGVGGVGGYVDASTFKLRTLGYEIRHGMSSRGAASASDTSPVTIFHKRIFIRAHASERNLRLRFRLAGYDGEDRIDILFSVTCTRPS